MIAAIGKALDRLAAAECKFRIARVADRPAAFAVAELEERAALPHRNNVLDQIWLGREIKIVDGRQRSVAAHGRTDAQHGVGARLARARRRRREALGAAREAQAMHL